MNIWSGPISLDPDRQLEGISPRRASCQSCPWLTLILGIRLVDPTSHWQCDISKTAKLGLRSFVNPALIPLHARAGPNLEVHTLNAGTSQWLQGKLVGAVWLNQDELDLHQSVQCPVGLLVSVDGTPARNTSVVTSDLLIYGVLSTATSCARPPTPPHSSPSDIPGQPNSSPGKPYQLRIYAAPLSTSLITQAQAFRLLHQAQMKNVPLLRLNSSQISARPVQSANESPLSLRWQHNTTVASDSAAARQSPN